MKRMARLCGLGRKGKGHFGAGTEARGNSFSARTNRAAGQSAVSGTKRVRDEHDSCEQFATSFSPYEYCHGRYQCPPAVAWRRREAPDPLSRVYEIASTEPT